MEELKPILQARVEVYGAVDEAFGPYKWNTAPMTVDDYADYYAGDMDKNFKKPQRKRQTKSSSIPESGKRDSQDQVQNQGVYASSFTFTARLTMYHPLAAVRFDTSKGPFESIQRNDSNGNPLRH